MFRRIVWLLTCIAFCGLNACASAPAPPVVEVPAELPAPPPSPEVLRWAGDWVEHWPGVPGEDRYRITLTDMGRTLNLEPLTRTDRQVFGDFQWDGVTLGFVLYLDNSPLHYRLEMDESGDLLHGIVQMPDGAMKRCEWRRRGTVKPDPVAWEPTPSPTEDTDVWLGLWEESWPGRREHDRYRIATEDDALVVRPQTDRRFQTVSDLQLRDGALTFRLQYGGNEVVYRLTVRDADTLHGTARMKSGKEVEILWTFIEP
ncbi:MAG TPA: hypothetical protein PKW95_08510 [bacterium]|nr:hypothetical protein [bacterium]